MAMTTLEEPHRDLTGGVHPLDDAAWASLTGPHAHFAQGPPDTSLKGAAQVLRYPTDVAPFIATSPAADENVWPALADLVGPDQVVALAGSPATLDQLPPDWTVEMRMTGVQFLSTDALESRPDPEAVVLGADDAAEMIDLVERTKPGPFLPRTYQLGTYLGFRDEKGALVAMAGERLHPPGYTEISAVCTDPAYRGQGLATRLVQAVAHGIRERGDVPFLHTAGTNVTAIRLYESIGFVLRQEVSFFGVRTPPEAPALG
jgi:ribosomal protein S18 acetylase RimI-like enzyme